MQKPRINKLTNIVFACVIAGTLDIVSACILNYKISPLKIFQFIASALFGKAAFNGGTTMVLWGVLFHYLIASFFSVLLFVTYPKLIKLFKNAIALGIIYGFFIWIIMNLAVLPVTNIKQSPRRFEVLNILTGTAALIICIGIPVALIAGRYYKKHPAGN